jgi:class 3 adenylate cyclase
VTVLFADVVHSMDIAAAVGAERLREIMAELLHCCTAVVKRYGGTLSQFTGRRHHGGVRRPNHVGGPRCSRLPGRLGSSRGGQAHHARPRIDRLDPAAKRT